MNQEKKKEKNVIIELTAAMISAGVEYALRHQEELVEAFGKKGKKRETAGLPARIGP